ncbi:unnamed protein product [Chrysodeixis includens]|uniref:Uncharacterized protein n=1 Tax=Chrysodeixis includens TaxID=689277 RepID=A0A9N8KXC8_CHRIL|nr:unnamed protein product [Chrysodeixis includens]
MFKILTAILYTIQIFILNCECLDLIDVPPDHPDSFSPPQPNLKFTLGSMYEPYEPPKETTDSYDGRRYWLLSDSPNYTPKLKANVYEDEKDINLKSKISTLVQQTMHDTDRKMKMVQQLKEKHREESPYRAGFILSLIKKSRDVLNELFNVAIKHRDEWKALEQLKIFELLVHTNVDTTNLLRQLVDIHLSYLNATSGHTEKDKKKVILL